MAKLNSKPIVAADLDEYLKSSSDFAFEVETLHLLHGLGLKCLHGGLYEDPVTGKQRQFDIRATAKFARTGPTTEDLIVRLAVECKNVRENYPVLVSCVPRTKQEAFHDFWRGIKGERFNRVQRTKPNFPSILYEKAEPVGKSIVQVGRLAEGTKAIEGSDADLFDKWTQCLSSAAALVEIGPGSKREDRCARVTVIPFLVVPDQRLWSVRYGADGALLAAPEQVNRCSFFVDRAYVQSTHEFHVSHVEVVTRSGMQQFVEQHLSSEDQVADLLPF